MQFLCFPVGLIGHRVFVGQVRQFDVSSLPACISGVTNIYIYFTIPCVTKDSHELTQFAFTSSIKEIIGALKTWQTNPFSLSKGMVQQPDGPAPHGSVDESPWSPLPMFFSCTPRRRCCDRQTITKVRIINWHHNDVTLTNNGTTITFADRLLWVEKMWSKLYFWCRFCGKLSCTDVSNMSDRCRW